MHIFDELSSIQVFAFDEVVGGHAVQAILSFWIVDCRLSIRCRFFGDVLQSAIFPDCRLSIVATVRPYTLCSGMNLLDVNQN